MSGEKKDTGGEPGAGREAPAPAAGGESPPSNTDYANSIGEGEQKSQALLRGIDSLYLSYQGKLKEDKERTLGSLRGLARSRSSVERASAQQVIGQHIFEVLDKGSGFYPFGLADNAFRIRLASRSAEKIPVAVVQVSSEFLASVGAEEAAKQLREVLDQLVDGLGQEKVSRADLFADFTTSANLEGIKGDDWVTRAEEIHTYSVRRKLSGWTMGLGGPMAARLYNKTLEIQEHSYKFFFHEMWEKAGWIPSDEVWRLEFELKRAALGSLGISSLSDLLRASGSLWKYLTGDWLRLTVPNPSDETRTRWPNHWLWTRLQGVEWEGNQPLSPREPKNTRAPEDGWYMSHGTSLLASYMAREGISDAMEGWRRLGAFLDHLVGSRPERYGATYEEYLLEKVRLKQRQYNTGANVSREPGSDDDEQDSAEAYRKASRGE
jgi:hypothetical protein